MWGNDGELVDSELEVDFNPVLAGMAMTLALVHMTSKAVTGKRDPF